MLGNGSLRETGFAWRRVGVEQKQMRKMMRRYGLNLAAPLLFCGIT